MRFITGSENSQAIIDLLSAAKPLKCAVAFLGFASLELLKDSKQYIKILCNLESGATNPHVIRKLRNQKNIAIRTLSNLHAKVYLNPDTAIVGSANLSANGLAFEDKELSGWLEAGVLIKEASLVDEIDHWFELQWSMANEIDDTILESAEVTWVNRRNLRPIFLAPRNNHSLLELLKTEPHRFKDRRIFFIMYRDWRLSDEAEKALETVQSQTYGGSAAQKIGCYEGWRNLPEDALIVDLYYGPQGGFSFSGLYQTRPQNIIEPFHYDDGEKGEIVLCFKVKSILGLKVSSRDQNLLKEKIAELWNLAEGDDGGRQLLLYQARTILFGNDK